MKHMLLVLLAAALMLACTAAAPAATPTQLGASASPVTTPSNQPNVSSGIQLRAVSFIDDQTGWVVGGRVDGKGSVLGTNDGGKTWDTLASLDIFPAGGLTQLRFVDARNGWLLTSVLLPGHTSGCAPVSTAPNECRTVIFRTSDGGRTWREQLSIEQPSKLGPGLRGLSAIDAQHAWAIRLDASGTPGCTPFDCSREIVGTSDGDHWTLIATLPAFSYQLDFVDARTGWATTYSAKNEPGQPTNTASILTTNDGGRTWTTQLSVSGAGPAFQVDFVDARNGWALEDDLADCGGGTQCSSYSLLGTMDGGRTWTKLQEAKPGSAWWSPRNTVSILGGPHFASASVGWIPITYEGGGNPAGMLLTKDGGSSWARVAPGTPNDVWDIQDLAVAGSTAWVVGQRIRDEAWFVARSDQSSTWTYQLVIPR